MQTKAGSKKYRQAMIIKHGSEEAYKAYMRSLGSKGGKTKTLTPKGFAAMDKDRLQKVSSKGGSKSKRGKNK